MMALPFHQGSNFSLIMERLGFKLISSCALPMTALPWNHGQEAPDVLHLPGGSAEVSLAPGRYRPVVPLQRRTLPCIVIDSACARLGLQNNFLF
jgi:hypothetical protein